VLEQEIPQGASVLDLGCGSGELLARLIERRGVRGQGIELAPEAVSDCIARGVPVIQSDLDEGLKGFPDGSFDFVVLEETLQTLRRPLGILQEMLRVGRRGAVSFPNFAFWKVWVDFAVRGRMPVTGSLPYQWYDSPNIHLFTYRDFADWAESSDVVLSKVFVRSGEDVRPFEEGDDFRGEEMLVFVEKKEEEIS
jgi:methionine biosynthesis protein MetW